MVGDIQRARERGQENRLGGGGAGGEREEEMKYRLYLDVLSAAQSNDKHILILHCCSPLQLTF